MSSIQYTDKAARLTRHLVADLCTGWIVHPSWGQEVLYAETPDGRVLKSNVLKAGQPHFFLKGRAWVEVDAVPENAEYCGQYKQI